MTKYKEKTALELFSTEELPPGMVAVVAKCVDGTELVSFLPVTKADMAEELVRRIVGAATHSDEEYLSTRRH